MSIIVDANCAVEALNATPTADFAPLLKAILTGAHKLTVGGTKQKREYQRLGQVWRFLKILDQAGRSRLVGDASVDQEERRVAIEVKSESDDPHILALARISGARILCSRDQALHADFTNPMIITAPRGRVYQNASHARLLATAKKK